MSQNIVFPIIAIALLFFISGCVSSAITPTKIGTEGCTGFQRLPIGSFELNQSGFEFDVTNQTGRTIKDVSIEASFDGSSKMFSNQFNGDDSISANAKSLVSFNKSLSSGEHSIDLFLSYNDGDFPRSATGTCRGTV
ncbi:hypothetical protein IIC68_03645 [archaeon]|nr:hypothetical protein [archaeon]